MMGWLSRLFKKKGECRTCIYWLKELALIPNPNFCSMDLFTQAESRACQYYKEACNYKEAKL